MIKAKHKTAKRRGETNADDLARGLDLSKLTQVIGLGIYAAEMRGEPALKVEYVVVDNRSLSMRLEDGRTISAPLTWYPRLVHATPGERNSWRLIMGGRAASWRSLGIAIAAKALLEGEKATESAARLNEWLSQRRGLGKKRRAG